MKMNRVEKFVMNSPVRAAIQRRYEAPLLIRMGGGVEGQNVLEIGCGQGVATQLLLQRFGARKVHAIDVDPEMIERASRRLHGYANDRLILGVGDVMALQAEDGEFDAVFDFAILHHVPDWQHAVSEICRVLKPGGRFFFQEVTTHALRKWSYRTFLDHPTENRFSAVQFIAEIERQGIAVAGNFVEKYFGDFVFGVGRKVKDH